MKIENTYQSITKPDFLQAIKREDFAEPQKGDGECAASLQISEEAQKRFEQEIQHFDRRIALPEYCGIYKTDKAVASAVEGCSKEEQIFVYGIIRQNFLKENTYSMTEEERQANIALGMKKAEYASENFIPEEHREKFLDAMNTIAKLASAGKADGKGNMDYGITKASYLGHGSNLVETTNTEDVMKHMDKAAYQEYQRISADSSDKDRALHALRYVTNWYIGAVSKRPGMMEEYESKNAKYMESVVGKKELPAYFDDLDVSSKETFLAGIRDFMSRQQGFLSGTLSLELTNRFWAS